MTTKERILEAATKLMTKEGFEHLRIDDLAKYIGISKKTLYNHFPGKYAIVQAAVDKDIKRISTKIDTILADRSKTFIERLAEILEYTFREISEWSKILIDEFSLIPKNLEQRHTEELRNKIIEIIKLLLEEGVELGIIRKDIRTEFLPYFYLTILEGCFHTFYFSDLDMSRENLFSQSINLTCLGILTPLGREHFEASPAIIPGMKEK